jgi:hypothetical protein
LGCNSFNPRPFAVGGWFWVFPLLVNGGYATGRRNPSFADKSKSGWQQPFCVRQMRYMATAFPGKKEPIFFFHNKFLSVLKPLADWNPACNENQLFEL